MFFNNNDYETMFDKNMTSQFPDETVCLNILTNAKYSGFTITTDRILSVVKKGFLSAFDEMSRYHNTSGEAIDAFNHFDVWKACANHGDLKYLHILILRCPNFFQNNDLKEVFGDTINPNALYICTTKNPQDIVTLKKEILIHHLHLVDAECARNKNNL